MLKAQDKLFLTFHEASNLLTSLGVQASAQTVKRRCYDGTYPSVKVGRFRRIPKAALEERLRELGAGESFRLGA